MTIRFAFAAPALTLGCALSAPALAQGPQSAAIDAAATNIVVTGAGKSTGGDIATLDLTSPAAAASTAAIPVGSGAGAVDIGVSSVVAAAAAAAAQGAPPARDERFSVVLNQDSFFGFYPTFNGLIPVSEKVDFSFYGIMWTTSDFSSATGFGSDLWTEFGIGANFYAADGKLQIKPQVGITNGALLSRGNLGRGPRNTTTTLNGGNTFDGIVPSLTVNYSDDKFEGEFYAGYYAALRNRSENVGALDFLHTWINAGYKFSKNFSAGGHIEFLANTRVDLPRARASNVYQWFGPYVQFSAKNGFFARFTGGVEEGGGAGGNRGDFYKLAVGLSF